MAIQSSLHVLAYYEIMLKVLRYMRGVDWVYAVIAVALIATQVGLELKIPDYMAEITRLVETPGSNMAAILSAGGWMLACAFGALVVAITTKFFVARIAAGLAMRLRHELYTTVMGFSAAEINTFSTASLITRSTNDITQVQNIVSMGLGVAVRAPIMAVWAIVKISGKNFQWTSATAIAVVVLLIMLSIVFALVVPKFKIVQELTDNVNLLTRENLTGLRVVHAYNAEDYEQDKFAVANDKLTGVNLFTQRVMGIMRPSMSLIMSGLTLSIYVLGAVMINAAGELDKITVFSDMVVFSAYAMQVVMSFMMMTMMLIILPRAMVSARRIADVLETDSSIVSGDTDLPAYGSQGDEDKSNTGHPLVEFDDVCFTYPAAESNVLHDISFTVEPGQTVALIGSTGSGKTSILNLITRFYDATEGTVRVKGTDVKDLDLEQLRDMIGYAPQKAYLFAGTVADNVAYGHSLDEEPDLSRVEWALRIAQADSFSPTDEITAGGTNVSGGQRQRLTIARAIYNRPELLLFDDSFSALDYTTDRAVREGLKELDATVIIVAQRVGTIMNADQIFVIDDGTIVGRGTHRELLEKCQVYQEIASSQLSEEEMHHAS